MKMCKYKIYEIKPIKCLNLLIEKFVIEWKQMSYKHIRKQIITLKFEEEIKKKSSKLKMKLLYDVESKAQIRIAK